ncbi:hypothetical protein [Novosphingobium sp.]|uniref:hypothetical protein n=1 Tax=Novosphingobium sp. TaxID=1874826 RepID=UPI0031DC0211
MLVTPIWCETSPLPPVAVFDGQWVEGRGFEQMLAALLGRYGVGEAVPFGAPQLLHDALERLSDRNGDAHHAAQASQCLDEVFDVCHTVRLVEEACGAREGRP